MQRVSLSALLAALLCCAAALGAHAETIEISGSTVIVKDMLQPAAAAIRQATGVEVKSFYCSTGRGMLTLFQGKAAMAAVAETLDEATASARKEMAADGIEVGVPANLVFHELGRDRVVVFVNKSNPVAALTKAQLKDLFTGKVRNWKEVGGPDLPVKVYLQAPGSSTRALLQKTLLDGAAYAADAGEYRNSFGVMAEMAKDRGGLAATGSTLLEGAGTQKLKAVQAPPIERPLAMVTIGKPSEPAQKVIDYLRKRGK